MVKNGSILCISLLSVMTLASCSRGAIETVDKSVDYKSAQSLPALRHPVHDDASSASSTKRVVDSSVTATLEQDKEGLPRLMINGRIDDAWQYLEQKLEAANVTVYNRNQSAGIFSIGCGGIADIPEFNKKSGFKILKRRKKVVETEYCQLQVAPSRRKTTSAIVVNRYGKVLGGDYVDGLFASILKN